jgi:hypothetical protein
MAVDFVECDDNPAFPVPDWQQDGQRNHDEPESQQHDER